MAKSLRASSVLNAKSMRRKGDYQKAVDARNERIAEKLKQDLIDQKKAEKGGMEIEENKEDTKDLTKVKTSGWREARHHTYKKAKLAKKAKKRKNVTRF